MSKLPTIPYKLYAEHNRERSACMDLSDRLRILSKSTISFLIKNHTEAVDKNLPDMHKLFALLQGKLTRYPYLYANPAIGIGFEEYVEAVLLYNYIKNKPLPTAASLQVTPDTYLGGLSDLTGELVRLAHQNEKQVKAIHDYVAGIYDLTIPLSITRNSATRTKLETIGSNLRKIESIIYDLKLRDKI
jgi:predicted translin family RNA/ssDNA-binding protein